MRWPHRLTGREFEQSPGDRGAQRSMVCLPLMGPQRVGHNGGGERQWWPKLGKPGHQQAGTLLLFLVECMWSLGCASAGMTCTWPLLPDQVRKSSVTGVEHQDNRAQFCLLLGEIQWEMSRVDSHSVKLKERT